MKCCKKILSIVLALMMVISVIPMTSIMAFAETDLNNTINFSDSAKKKFNGHIYQIFKDSSIGWHDAKVKCESMGGHLATIQSEAENMFVYELVKQAGFSCWLGATDEEDEGVWKWVTGEPWTYSSASFDNRNGLQHYLVINWHGNTLWDDQSEKSTSQDGFLCDTGGYVCEWDKTGNSADYIQIGDCITLGNYFGNPIVWVCVLIDENGPLMLSKDIICQKEYDAKGFNPEYHTDSWGYVRENNGSNCWQDSNIRQWLNSKGKVNYTHCTPSYADEDGFLSNFTELELNCVKTVTHKVTVVKYDSTRSDYCIGGSNDSVNPFSESFDINNYYHNSVDDTFMLLDAQQIHDIYYNNSDYLVCSGRYFTACISGNNYACFDNTNTFPAYSTSLDNKYTAEQVFGIRPAFYLNVEQNFINDLTKAEFNSHTYQIFDESISWTEAQSKCKDMGGHLVTINSAEEQSFLIDFMTTSSINKKNVWIGAYRDNDTFKWVTGEKFAYENWADGEPNNVFDRQNVTMMYTQNASNPIGSWNDENENGRDWNGYYISDFGFICEWDSTSVVETQKSIAVFTTEKSLSVKTGDSLSLSFGILNEITGELEAGWKKMALVVSDLTILSLSDYKETEYGYALDVIGKKEGITNITISDTESGANTIITVSVYDDYVHSYSYAIDNIASFYPNNKLEYNIETNIYNLNGLYVNKYQCTEDVNTYKVNFDVYNSRYYSGAIDIYDVDGMWLGYEEINKYKEISSLVDTGKQFVFLITDLITGKIYTYEQAASSVKTHISIDVPKGGYFTISNNVATSPGTFFINAFEILFDGASTALDLFTSDSIQQSALTSFKKSAAKTFADRLIEARNEGLKDEAKKHAQKVILSSMQKKISDITKDFTEAEIKDKLTLTDNACSEIASYAENILNAFNISWKSLFQTAAGIGESYFTKISGPAGVALKGCFAISKSTNKLLMAAQMAMSTNKPYATVYSSIDEGYINPYGVTVNTNGNMDADAVLQVFKVSNDNTIDAILDSNNPLQDYALYNICFIKNDKLVQPNGKVSVRVPIPAGMKSDTCNIFRQEPNGEWTILEARIEGNYLVFETDHFSLYGIVGETDTLTIASLPNKTNYKDGETLNTDGLILNLNGKTISDGFICEPTVLSGSGKQIIIVKYGYTSTEFAVNVNNADVYPTGDVNGDEIVDAADAVMIQRYDAGLTNLTSEQLSAGDVNGDGIVDAADAVKIQRYDAGLIDTL